MIANNLITLDIIPEDSTDTSYETDIDWQLQCRDIFLSLRNTAASDKITIQPKSAFSEPGAKDITAIFSSILIFLPVITGFAQPISNILASILQFKQSKKIVLEETIKEGKSEYTRKIEIDGPIDKEAISTMTEFFTKSVSKQANITLRIARTK
jgi:hypothetical protein